MYLRDLVEHYPSATLDSPALDAVRSMADEHRLALIVLDEHRRPYAVLSSPQILSALLPDYVVEDPHLAHVLDSSDAEQMIVRLGDLTVGDLMPREVRQVPVLSDHDTNLEAAAYMANEGISVVAVVSDDHYVGAVTVSRLLRDALGRPS
ncbi:MAG: CBS domain-containing protein [Propionibacterium sp.]|nr:CBS domain-containing protein [Propionibacterium sp.]